MNRRWLRPTLFAKPAEGCRSGAAECVEREAYRAVVLRLISQAREERHLDDAELGERSRHCSKPVTKLTSRPTPQRLQVHVRIDQLADRQIEEWKGAAGSEVHAEQRRFFGSVDDEESVVRARDDRTREALADASTNSIINTQLVVPQIDDELDRPARQNPLLQVRWLVVVVEPDVLDEIGEWRSWAASAVQHGVRMPRLGPLIDRQGGQDDAK
jgi:hypothetical protein